MVQRDAAVVQKYSGSVRGANTKLVFHSDYRDSWRAMLDDERFDSRPSGIFIHRCPNHDKTVGLFKRPLARSAKNLSAVEHPVVAFSARGGGDSRRIGATTGFSDRHRAPFRFPAFEPRQKTFLLLGRSGGGYRCSAKTWARNRQKKPCVAPAKLLDKYRGRQRTRRLRALPALTLLS